MDNTKEYCCNLYCCFKEQQYENCIKSFCCSLKCFNIMKITHVDGKACRVCNAYSYCKCKCK